MNAIQKESFTPELQNTLFDGFRRNAVARLGVDQITDAVAFVARDIEGNHVGSVVVQLFWGGLHIKYLFVEEAYRGQGIAKMLVEEALTYGRQHNATFAFVETMSYLNVVAFYERMGFHLEFTRQGFTHNNSFHYLRKNLL